jgi:hypothetical protein
MALLSHHLPSWLALAEGWMLLARLATELAVTAEAHARDTPSKDED